MKERQGGQRLALTDEFRLKRRKEQVAGRRIAGRRKGETKSGKPSFANTCNSKRLQTGKSKAPWMSQGIFTSSVIRIQSLNKDPSSIEWDLQGVRAVGGERRIDRDQVSSVRRRLPNWQEPPLANREHLWCPTENIPPKICLPATTSQWITPAVSLHVNYRSPDTAWMSVCMWARAAINRRWHLMNGSWATTLQLMFTAAASLLNPPDCSRKI